MSIQTARNAAERLADSLGVRTPPMNVEAIAKRLGLAVVREDLGADISGLLVSRGRGAVIGVHSTHPKNRQRFTIAHEIGHFFLRHQFESGEHVHVDSGRFISLRSSRAPSGVDQKEVEANQFAASLLMPSKLLRAQVLEMGGRPLTEEQIEDLARGFEVSVQAMTIRLTTLDLA